MKLFRTSDMEFIKFCQSAFIFVLSLCLFCVLSLPLVVNKDEYITALCGIATVSRPSVRCPPVCL